MQVLLVSQSIAQLPLVHARSHAQPAGQTQVLPEQVSLQQSAESPQPLQPLTQPPPTPKPPVPPAPPVPPVPPVPPALGVPPLPPGPGPTVVVIMPPMPDEVVNITPPPPWVGGLVSSKSSLPSRSRRQLPTVIRATSTSPAESFVGLDFACTSRSYHAARANQSYGRSSFAERMAALFATSAGSSATV